MYQPLALDLIRVEQELLRRRTREAARWPRRASRVAAGSRRAPSLPRLAVLVSVREAVAGLLPRPRPAGCTDC